MKYQDNSQKIRHLVALLTSTEVEQMTFKDFWEKVEILKAFYLNGNEVYAASIYFNKQGKISRVDGGLINKYIWWDFYNYSSSNDVTFEDRGDPSRPANAKMSFDANERLAEVLFDPEAYSARYAGKMHFPKKTLSHLKQVKFLYKDYSNEPVAFAIQVDLFFAFQNSDQWNATYEKHVKNAFVVSERPNHFIRFDAEGSPQCLTLKGNSLRFPTFQIKLLGAKDPKVFNSDQETTVKFNADGAPISFGCEPLTLDD